MAFWDKVRDDVKKGMKQGVSVLKQGSNIATEKAGQMAEIGKVRYQTFLTEQKREKIFSEVGERIYELNELKGLKNLIADPIVKRKLAEAKKLDKKVKTLHGKMATLRKKTA